MQTFQAALSEANALHKAGRLQEAVSRYEALLRTSPDHAKILYYAGSAYAALGRIAEATAALERSLSHASGDVPTIEMLGSTWMMANRPENALPYFRDAARMSGTTEAAMRFANALIVCRLHADAVPVLEGLLHREAVDARVYVTLALCLSELKKPGDAERYLRTCLVAHPDYKKGWSALAKLLAQQERFKEAEDAICECLKRNAADAEIERLRANILHKQGRFSEAETAYRAVLRLAPDDVQALYQFAEVMLEFNRLDEAEAALRRALSLKPNDSAVLTDLGRVHELRGALTEALALHDRALMHDPSNHNALVNRGTTKRFLGNLEDAIADYDAALTLRPGHPPAAASRAIALLAAGRLQEAWPDYRARIKARGGARDFTDGKPWDGTPLTGKRVLVWTEYGLGDEILFASLIPEILVCTAHCTLVCSPRLVDLFSRSFPGLRVVPWDAPLDDGYDVRMPLTDCAQLLRPSLASIPHHSGYLHVDPAQVATFRARYRRSPEHAVVGISWRSAAGPTGRFKSTELAQWADILRTPRVSFVSLQYGECRDDVRRATNKNGTEITIDAEVDATKDVNAFAAQVAAMDLIISVSNTTVHVAGALGRPTWVLTPTGPGMHWYWFQNRTDNPWYPSLRLFRQTVPMDWSGPLKSAAAELRRRFAAS